MVAPVVAWQEELKQILAGFRDENFKKNKRMLMAARPSKPKKARTEQHVQDDDDQLPAPGGAGSGDLVPPAGEEKEGDQEPPREDGGLEEVASVLGDKQDEDDAQEADAEAPPETVPDEAELGDGEPDACHGTPREDSRAEESD